MELSTIQSVVHGAHVRKNNNKKTVPVTRSGSMPQAIGPQERGLILKILKKPLSGQVVLHTVRATGDGYSTVR